jgi:hypothetical protein
VRETFPHELVALLQAFDQAGIVNPFAANEGKPVAVGCEREIFNFFDSQFRTPARFVLTIAFAPQVVDLTEAYWQRKREIA